MIHKLVITFFYFSVLFRPILPTIAYELNKMNVGAGSIEHSWLVQQLLKQVENENKKYEEVVRATIEYSSLSIPDLENFSFKLLTPEKENKFFEFNPFQISSLFFSIFHPPKF